MILDFFDHAFVINADQERERWARTSDRLAREGIACERLPAIVPAEIADRRLRGEIGCTRSHHAAVRLAQQRGYRSVLIFEDDIVFRSNFGQLWDELKPKLDQIEYDLFYFYNWAKSDEGAPAILPLSGSLCAHAYAVHHQFYDSFLNVSATDTPARRVIDQVLKNVPGRKWGTRPNLIGQDAGPSTIYHRNHVRRWSARDG